MARNVLPAAIPREISSRSLKLSTLGARLRCAGAIPPEACRTRYRFVVRWPSALAVPEPSRQLYMGARVLRVLSLEPLHPLQLLIGVPPGCGEVFSQFLRGAPRTVPGRVTLDTPPFLQGAGVHRVEAELVEQLRDRGLRSRIVASYGKRTAVVRARPLSVGRELRRVNVVECLDDLRGRQVRLQELRGGRRLVVELLDVAVSLWVVVVRVDHDLARQGLDRDLPVVLERDGDHNDVPSLCGVDSRRRARIRSELGNERRQGFRPTRVADHNPVAVCRRKSRDLASDVTGADESYGLHATHGLHTTQIQISIAAASSNTAVNADQAASCTACSKSTWSGRCAAPVFKRFGLRSSCPLSLWERSGHLEN